MNKKEVTQSSSIGQHKVDDIVDIVECGEYEDTIKKSNGKWTNRGDDGAEHGEFDTKKQADAQRKAMFANGYTESIEFRKVQYPDQYGEYCRKAWELIDNDIDVPVIIEYREYFDNWNNKVSKEYVVHFDEYKLSDYVEYDEYSFRTMKDAKNAAHELLDLYKQTMHEYNEYDNDDYINEDYYNEPYDYDDIDSDFDEHGSIRWDYEEEEEEWSDNDYYDARKSTGRRKSNKNYSYDDEDDYYDEDCSKDSLDEDIEVSTADDNGNYITIDIGNIRYEYSPKEDCPYDIYELVTKFNGIRKHSHGRALAWIKKYATGKKVGIVVEAKNSSKISNELYNKCYKVLKEFMTSEGFDDSEVDEYSTIDINNNDDNISINVRAELSYDSMIDLANDLNDIVKDYDKDAYFDVVDSGIIESVVYLGNYIMRESNEYEFCEEVLLKDLKPGEYFTIKPIEYPNESQVYIKGDYDRSERKYDCGKFSDISYSRLIPGNKKVYIGFTF